MRFKENKNLRREDSHVSNDNVVWRKNERRITHIKRAKQLLDVIKGETTFSDIINQCGVFESLRFKLPKNQHEFLQMEPDTLVQIVEDLERERSLLSKLASAPTLGNKKFMEVDEK